MTAHPRRLRAAAAVLLVSALSGAIASCRGVVVGKSEDGVAALCDLLTRCYGAAAPKCADLTARFDGAPAATSASFLGYLTANGCLASCAAAKGCWDQPPICIDLPDAHARACARPEDCCGFTSGAASCDKAGCCVPHAVKCTPGSTRCCNGEVCYTPAPTETPTCGGAPPCGDPGRPCGSNGDCCSKRCDSSSVCANKNLCQPEGGGCVSAKDCCDNLACSKDSSGQGHCSTGPVCSFGSACAPPTTTDPGVLECKPGSADACCGQPDACVPDETGLTGVCVDLTKPIVLPNGFECASDANCCEGHCDKTSTPVCAKRRTCAVFSPSCYPVACTDADHACSTEADCCAGQCVDARCTCGISSCHGPLEVGPPIACPPGMPQNTCTYAVCAVDPACCCSAWDELCVQQAANMAGCK